MTDSDRDTISPKEALQARLLLVGLLVMLLGLGGYILYARGMFETTQTLILVTDDSEGVTVGTDMTFAGFPLGRVTRLELAPDGRARIVISVPERNAGWLRQSSIFTIERNMIGAVRIRAYSGIMDDPILNDGAERQLIRGDAFGEIQKLVQPIQELLDRLVKIVEIMQGPQGALRLIFGNEQDARRVVSAIERSEVLLENLNRQVFGVNNRENAGLVRASHDVVNELKTLLSQTRESIEKVNDILNQSKDSVDKVNAILDDSKETVGKVNSILDEGQVIAENARKASKDLDLLREEIESNLRKIDVLLEEVSRKWPFAKDPQIKLP
jgi:phospholipid/cholesterol/gamma-HCH transport system substrate-binding protein